MKTTKLVGFFVALCFMAGCADAQPAKLPLQTVADVPLTGNATRLDYQSFDAPSGRLYIAHLADDMLTVFDVKTQKIVGDIKDLKRVHGVIAVPELRRVYASATGTNELAVIDDQTLKIIARVPAGDYPDGIAYAIKEKKLYVSDLHGKTDTVIDAVTNKVVATIALNAPAGNTQYDEQSDRIFVAVHTLNAIIEIDPGTDKIVGTYPLAGCESAHGLLIDGKNRYAFAACEGNAKLAMFDMTAKKMVAIYQVGDDPDVLAFDAGLGRLYVSAESGVVAMFDEKKNVLETVALGFYVAKAHTVAVDSSTHLVYLPIENLDGRPVLRIVRPSDKTTK
ncbi:MAG TPA: YncE family protein [Pyrinomonadaceae bacterium]|nr:YncE family protein [Pyrinomonadaceae bacterium]